MKLKVIILILLLICCFELLAKDKFPIQIINHEPETTLEQLFIYEIKEQIRKSETMKIFDYEKDKYRLILLINTMPRLKENPEDSIIYSTTWVFTANDFNTLFIFINNKLGYTGRNTYETSSKSIVAETDEIISTDLKLKTYVNMIKEK